MAADGNLAVPPVLAMPPPVATTVCRSYAEQYSVAASDPFDGEYASVMSMMRTSNNPIGAMALLDQVINTDASFPNSVLGIFEDGRGEEGRSLLLSGLQRYPVTLGRPTGWDNRIFAFAGDVIEGEIPSVEIPPDIFDVPGRNIYTNVPGSLERVDELLIANPNQELLGPFANNDAYIRQARCRYAVYVPPKYIPLVSTRRLTPRELWADLIGSVRANGDADNCKELVDWVVCALVRASAVTPSSLCRPPLTIPLPDRDLIKRRRERLLAQIPGLAIPVAADATLAVTTQLAGFVGQLVEEQRMTRSEIRTRAEDTKAPKSPSVFWGEEACNILCTVCQVGSEQELPRLWKSLAAAGKRDRMVVEHALAENARQLGLVEMAPIATPELTKRLVGLRFAGDDVDDLSEGIQPFALSILDHGAVGFNTTDEILTLRQSNEEYDILTAGSTSTTLADAKSFRAQQGQVKLPADYTHLRVILQAQGILLRTMLGETHLLTQQYIRFVDHYAQKDLFYRGRLQALRTAQAPARLLRFIQIRLINWFRDVRQLNVRLPPPDFSTALTSLSLNESSWLPELPPRYIQPSSTMISTAFGNTAGTSVATFVSNRTQGPHEFQQQPGSVLSNFTADSASSQHTNKRQRLNRDKVDNSHKNPKFTPYLPAIGRSNLTEIISKVGPPPTITRNGVPTAICASYHLKGKCWSTCYQAADHTKHTAQEDALLLAWCEKAFA